MTIRFDIHIPKKGKHKLVPSVAIQLVWESLEEDGQDGEVLVTPHMNTEKEIDASIDHLIAELNELREKTKIELRRREQERSINPQPSA
ncbi:MAG TPA: hypothetical protein VIM85_11015 [Pseudomonadales bacterium]